MRSLYACIGVFIYALYRQEDHTVETPPTHATALVASTTNTATPTPTTDTATVLRANDTLSQELYYEVRQHHESWIYDDIVTPRKETVESEMYESVELISEVGNNHLVSQTKEELQLTDVTESMLVPRYMELVQQEGARDQAATARKETVESALYQSVEDLNIQGVNAHFSNGELEPSSDLTESALDTRYVEQRAIRAVYS